MVVSRGVKADTVVGAGGEYRMGKLDFAVVEDNDGDVLEGDVGGFSCSMAREKCSRRSLAGREIITLRQPTTFLR
jgi:hypothetical protein